MKRQFKAYCVICDRFWTPDIKRNGIRCSKGHWPILRHFGWGGVPKPEEFGTSYLYNRPGVEDRIFTISNYIQHPNDRPTDDML